MTSEQALDAAGKLVAKGALDEAEVIIDRLIVAGTDSVDQTQVLFLKGMIQASRGEYRQAEKVFRHILSSRPDLIRIRLELARTLYEQKKYAAAAYHFRLGLGEPALPDDTKANIRRYLALIEHKRIWKISVSAGLEPSSNINSATSNEYITLFGLPFELSDTAQAESGTGLSTSVSASIFPRLNSVTRLETRIGAQVTDFSNADYDNAAVNVSFGPRFETKRFNASVLATGSKRQFGGDDYSTSYGARLVLETPLTERTRFAVRLGGEQVDYNGEEARSGPVWSIGASFSRVINRRSSADIGITLVREEAAVDPLKSTQVQLYTTYNRELPWGITAGVRPEFIWREFDGMDPLFREVRKDETYALSIRIAKRDWRLYGFAPVFSYGYLLNSSTIELYDYDRHSADIGLARGF